MASAAARVALLRGSLGVHHVIARDVDQCCDVIVVEGVQHAAPVAAHDPLRAKQPQAVRARGFRDTGLTSQRVDADLAALEQHEDQTNPGWVADIALIGDDPRKLPALIGLARWTRTVVQQNIAFSLGAKLIAAILLIAGALPLWGAVATDVAASLLVVANGLRVARSTPLGASRK